MLPVVYEPEVQELGELGWGFKPFKAIGRAMPKFGKRGKRRNAARIGGKIRYAVLKKVKQQRKPTITKVSCNLHRLQQIYNNNKKVLEQNRKIYLANLRIYNNNKKVLEQNRKIYLANLQIYNNNKKVVNEFKQLLRKYGLA